MDILPLMALGFLITVILVMLRPLRPEMATILALAAGAFLIVLILGRLRGLVQTISDLAIRVELHPLFLRTALKVIGLAYLAGFTAQVCRDSGEGAMAGKVELVGKVAILALAMPVMWAVLNTLLELF